MDREAEKVNDLEGLSEVKDSEFVEVEVEGKTRRMTYRHSGFELDTRTFFSRIGNSNYVSQFVINKDQISFEEGILVFNKPYEKSSCNITENIGRSINYVLGHAGL